MCLLGDVNTDLMHYNEHKPTNHFVDSLASNSYFPYIIQPVSTQVNWEPVDMIMDNIFSNFISKDIFW